MQRIALAFIAWASVEFWHQQSDAARLERTLTQILPSDAPSRRRSRL